MPTDKNSRRETGAQTWLEKLSHWVQREPVDRDALVDILRDASDRDLVDRDSADTIERVLKVSELRVRDIMIPRSQMVVVDKENSPDEMLPLVIESAHSRFPVIDEDRDKVVGILLAKDLLRYFDEAHKTRFNMRDLLRPAVFVPDSKRLNILLAEFRASRNHMAIVVDEYAGVAGLVTIEDVLEQIVGDIEDEHDVDSDAGMIMKHGPNDYVIKALVTVEDFNEYFNTNYLNNDVDTIGGLVMSELGKVPKRGDSLVLGNYEFEVLHADSRRVYLFKLKTDVDQL
ncbi:HlyC/CorC family transporter [Pseudomonadota bacterium]